MEKLISKIKNMDLYKKIAILFIAISLAFITVVGVKNSFNKQKTISNTETKTTKKTVDDTRIVNEEKTETENLKSDEVSESKNKKETNSKTSKKVKETTTNGKVTKEKSTSTEQKSTTNSKTNNQSNTNSVTKNSNDTGKISAKNSNESTQQSSSAISKEENKTTDSNSESNVKNQNQVVEDKKSQSIEKISVNLVVTGVHQTITSQKLSVEKNTTAYAILKKAGLAIEKNGFGSAIYVTSINGLKEKEYGASSGWMYKVNGTAPNYGANSYKLKEGDQVTWYYVNYD